MFRSFILSLAAVCLSASPGVAMTAAERNAHVDLAQAVIDSNVEVSINEKEHCFSLEGRFFGSYNASKRVIAICQENATEWNGEVVEFSEEDLDTLRHEAQHLVQDCLDGEIDGRMTPMFTGDARAKFLSHFSDSKEQRVRETYADGGDALITLEVEAFAVADTVPAASISNAVRRTCMR